MGLRNRLNNHFSLSRGPAFTDPTTAAAFFSPSSDYYSLSPDSPPPAFSLNQSPEPMQSAAAANGKPESASFEKVQSEPLPPSSSQQPVQIQNLYSRKTKSPVQKSASPVQKSPSTSSTEKSASPDEPATAVVRKPKPAVPPRMDRRDNRRHREVVNICKCLAYSFPMPNN